MKFFNEFGTFFYAWASLCSIGFVFLISRVCLIKMKILTEKQIDEIIIVSSILSIVILLISFLFYTPINY